MKIIKSLEESDLFIKGVSETIKNEAKEQKRGLYVFIMSPTSLRVNPHSAVA